MMKKFWLVGLIVAAMAMPSVLLAQVEVGSGTMQLGGKVKWLYVYKAEDEDSVGASTNQVWGLDGAGVEQFATTNVEIDINGTVSENVSYVIELEASVLGGGFGGVSNMGELAGSAVGVRQAKMMFADIIPMTTVTVGTFNLPVGNYQPRATNDWDLINLPLINSAVWAGNSAGFYNPVGLGWQATGVNAKIQPVDMFSVDIAYFNGYAGNNPNIDVDLEKSWLINLSVMPMEGACISFAYLMEGWQEDLNGSLSTEQQNAKGWVLSGALEIERFEGNFDYMTMTAEDYQQIDLAGKLDDLTWKGYQLTLGYWVMDTVEVLVRYEWVDPNTEDSKKTFIATGYASKYDALTSYTFGLNLLASDNAEVAINYVILEEEGKMIDMDKPLKVAGADNGKYQALNNDFLMVQVQVWQ